MPRILETKCGALFLSVAEASPPPCLIQRARVLLTDQADLADQADQADLADLFAVVVF
jgi:hypothetical protein